MRVLENYAKFLDNMLNVLECNGLLFVNDNATYTEGNNGAFAINRIC